MRIPAPGSMTTILAALAALLLALPVQAGSLENPFAGAGGPAGIELAAEGKCGGADADRCGSGKCGESDERCGSGKCGDGKRKKHCDHHHGKCGHGDGKRCGDGGGKRCGDGGGAGPGEGKCGQGKCGGQ